MSTPEQKPKIACPSLTLFETPLQTQNTRDYSANSKKALKEKSPPLNTLLLFTITLYLLLFSRHTPAKVQSLIRSSSTPAPSPSNTTQPMGPTFNAKTSPTLVAYPAKSADCTFGLLANGYDFSFYLHYNGTGRVSQEVITQGNLFAYPDGLWASFREHREHCWYLAPFKNRKCYPERFLSGKVPTLGLMDFDYLQILYLVRLCLSTDLGNQSTPEYRGIS
ncbi:hypothetical protein BDW75DRAFT_242969 [Aspergillus navahoensis]